MAKSDLAANPEAAPLAAPLAAPARRLGMLAFLGRIARTPAGFIGLAVVILLVGSAAFADLIAPYSPIKMGVGKRFLAPRADDHAEPGAFHRPIDDRGAGLP